MATQPRTAARRRTGRRSSAGNGPLTAAQLARMIQPAVVDRTLPHAFARASNDAVAALKTGKARRGIYFTARQQLAYRLIETVVHQCGGDRRLAARVLGISHSSVKALSLENRRQSMRQRRGMARKK